VSVNKPIHCCK